MLLENGLILMDDVEVAAVCDKDEDKLRIASEKISAKNGNAPLQTNSHEDILRLKDIDAVIVGTGWSGHIPIVIDSMRAGKYVAFEVGGAYSLNDCWRMVNTYEETKTPCMMLENCCYGRTELMVLNMVRRGEFGEIVHCSGGYHHDLRSEDLLNGNPQHYRLHEYINRNCENYPTHEIGTIAKVLNINHGNRMISLTSTASKAAGLHKFILKTEKENHKFADVVFQQGDIVTTVIKCAHCQTITLTLDTTLPRPYYTRAFQVRGVNGMYTEETDTVYIESNPPAEAEVRGNGDEYREKYDHPIWKEYLKQGVKAGHGGIDWLVLRAFIESVRRGENTPIDVYDAASWMSISTLSEQSIACGSIPMAIPDFTNGQWIARGDSVSGKYRLD